MKPRVSHFPVHLLLPLGLLALAACGGGAGPTLQRAATNTPGAPLPMLVETGVPAAVPSTGPVGFPTATPAPPPRPRDPARPISYAELRAAAAAPYPTVPAFDWALGKAVQDWQGWVVDPDRRADGSAAAVIVMEDPYAPLPAPPAAAQRPYNENSALAYVLLESPAANGPAQLQVGQQVRFGGTISQIAPPDFRVWLQDAQVAGVTAAPATRPVPADLQGLRISLSRSRCLGPCPVYRVTVYSNGRLVWEGDRYVQTGGVRITTVDEATVRRLVAAFESSDYFAWHAEYTEQNLTDAPTVLTAFERGGKSHTITHYQGDSSAPPALRTLEDEIDAILKTDQWVGPR